MNTGSVSKPLFRFHRLSRQVTFECVSTKDELDAERN